MRARAGDPPRTMSQKVLAAHCDSGSKSSDLIEVKVDQVVLAREPSRVLGSAVERGLTKSVPEVCIAYPPRCVAWQEGDADPRAPHRVPQDAISLGFLVAQPGAGFASATHLERFGSPARLVLTDEPRLASCGAAGMLTLPASRAQLSEALLTGTATLRPARSLQINLSGRLRPFVCARDVALELCRRGLSDVIAEVDAAHGAPVVLEFTGSSCKFLSVGDRAVLCGLAPLLGAASALFASDEKTEIFLRDQRRSKAHRSLNADSGAPWEGIVSIDLAAVDPLLKDQEGKIRPVRDYEGEKVGQVLLGGDTGLSLRDLLAAAALLKSKRVSPGVEFLFCCPSRQTLEVLARGDTLVDLLATGARLIEADRRSLTGDLYPAPSDGISIRNADWEGDAKGFVASAETLAFAVANGEIGDPRQFKRPVRISLPRNLPTDDVLISRGSEARGGAKGKGRVDKRAVAGATEPPTSDTFAEPISRSNWDAPLELALAAGREDAGQASAFVARNLEDVRWFAENAHALPELHAVIAEHIPTAMVSVLSGLGILALRADRETLDRLTSCKQMRLTSPRSWSDEDVEVAADDAPISVRWLAVGPERDTHLLAN